MKWESCGKKPGNSPPEVARIFSGGMNQARERTPNRSTGGCISQTSISKHSTGPAADSLSRALHQITRTRHRSRHTPTHSGIISKSHGTPERSSHDNRQPVSPTQSSPGGRASVPLGRMRQRPLPVLLEKFRSPKPLVLATTRRRLHHSLFPSTATRSSCDFPTSLTRTLHQLPRRQGSRHRGPHETAPSSGGPRKISKSKTTPLPVLFFITCNFTSPFDCNSIVFPTRLARTVHKLPRRLGFRTPRPHATAPSSGGPRKISKSKNTPLPVLVFISLALPFDCNSIVLRLSYEPHTKSAQTSPDGRAPVPLGRMRQRPLPVLLEKFRSPKTLLLATTRCRRHHLICPSTATRSSRNLHTSLAPTPPRQGSRHRGPHPTTPSSGGPRKISKSKTTPLPVLFFITCNFTSPFDCNSIVFPTRLARTVHKLPRRLGFRTPRPHATAPSSGGPRKISKSKTTRSHHFLLCSSQVSPRRPIHSEPLTTSLHPLGSTSPDGRAPVTRARTRRRPLPVLLEKFRSPKPLLLASSRSSLALRHEPRTHFSRRQGSRHRGPQPTTPSSGGPSPGPLHFTLASNSDFFFFFLFSKQLSSVFRGPLGGNRYPKQQGAPAEPASPPDEG
ncbi:hypothetical protein TNCT_354251 [Trichonephila clavata]|uniref:Uncharacterized protein n=1 Tax=Trichonephila clavata TaxID=2740835 RepID=A0A8X6L7C3_TRICU|nr:hypothetical protein TNCT_354251 [Trichonephila clavata]